MNKYGSKSSKSSNSSSSVHISEDMGSWPCSSTHSSFEFFMARYMAETSMERPFPSKSELQPFTFSVPKACIWLPQLPELEKLDELFISISIAVSKSSLPGPFTVSSCGDFISWHGEILLWSSFWKILIKSTR